MSETIRYVSLVKDPRCGTYAGWQAHNRHGEYPCDACIEVKRAYYRTRGKVQQRARHRALIALRDLYLGEYEDLYNKHMLNAVIEQATKGTKVTPSRHYDNTRKRALSDLAKNHKPDYRRLVAQARKEIQSEGADIAQFDPRLRKQVTSYAVSCVPEDHEEVDAFTLTVEWRGRDRWAVRWASRGVWGTDGQWSYEPNSSNRTEEWLDAHRFSENEALAIAYGLAPTLKVRGVSVDDVLNPGTPETSAQRAVDGRGGLKPILYTPGDSEAVRAWLGDACREYCSNGGGIWFSTGRKHQGLTPGNVLACAYPGDWIVPQADGTLRAMTDEEYRNAG